ncbi:hypothetical protein VPNG_00163 [Cytospora leucostoma]|uniref:Arrestin C-terminal-like domain-containing protein n=1 Tax=Cytospora leucostoma TaxID=1230097 RepID=A0A423XPE2_9PEZI|nr:hypothetical protein VPNG_00163 [Cytospora leucostoma]
MVTLPGTTSKASTSTTLEDQQQSSSRSSFFSRFALPIRSRNTRNVVDFHIRPSEPHRKFNAGDHVKGAVVLTVVKPIRLTHLTVALRGFVRVHKSPNNAAADPVNPPGIDSDGVSQFKFLGNGYASLFQDEQVLCADGRLESGKYEFNFDLLFPESNLPSSIEFERGAIGYTIIATLTRPTSINATTSCERKVELVEQVDVGLLPATRPRTIYLQPISKKTRRKKQVAYTTSDKADSIAAADTAESSSEFDSTRAVDNSSDGIVLPPDDAGQDAPPIPISPIQSDLRSEVSLDSAVSGSTGLSFRDRVDSNSNQAGSLGTIQAGGGKRAVSEEKTITTTIESVKSGCLPGDTLPVKVDVQHTKRIKSLHGVIVTLYRQGRVDSAPPAALFKNISREEARKLEKEEYYPKSKTGLGGLSLTSAGTCSMFRKDLSQAFSPLIIDPTTLTASVTTSVRVPENAFPSIRGVPGEMISFKYRLEVIVDLGGKLANAIQVQQNPRVGSAGGVLTSGRELTAGVASFDGSMINTDPLKRGKGVIFDSFEVVVGTTDSTRRGKAVRPATSLRTRSVQEPPACPESGPWPGPWEDEGYAPEAHPQENMPYTAEPVSPYPYWNGGSQDQAQPPAPQYIPPPVLPDESGLSDKDRIRRAEQRLLPSQPEGSSPISVPSAPAVDADGAGPSTFAPSAPPPASPTVEDPSSAPTLEDLAASSSVPPEGNSVDDKQELERQRLLAEASAPPEFPGDGDAGVGSSAGPSAPPPDDGPSAPVLNEEDYGPQYSYNEVAGPSSQGPSAAHEPLPAYKR